MARSSCIEAASGTCSSVELDCGNDCDIGLDIATSAFQVHGVDAEDSVRRQLQR
jgi:hypothetical protein